MGSIREVGLSYQRRNNWKWRRELIRRGNNLIACHMVRDFTRIVPALDGYPPISELLRQLTLNHYMTVETPVAVVVFRVDHPEGEQRVMNSFLYNITWECG